MNAILWMIVVKRNTMKQPFVTLLAVHVSIFSLLLDYFSGIALQSKAMHKLQKKKRNS